MCVMQMLGLESVNTADSSFSQHSRLTSPEDFTPNMQPYYSTLLGLPQITHQLRPQHLSLAKKPLNSYTQTQNKK